MNLKDSTWEDVRDYSPSVALIPVGSTEQHGPHAPLSTDSLIAERLAHDADRETEEVSTAVLPTVPIGISEEHRGFDGTVYVSPPTFRSYLTEIADSAPADTVVFVNGHGGNIDALHEVSACLTRGDDVAFATHWTWWKAVDTDTELDIDMGHAGAVETSVLLHIAPELLGEPTEGAESWGEYAEKAPLSYDTEEFTENGVVGDATQGSSEKGKRLYEQALASLLRLLETVETE